MKKYLIIANEGILEPAALTLIGASTKADDPAKIGMFGSGNKYALAYLVRNGYDLHIMSGPRKLKIETVVNTLRGKEFNVLKIEGRETSITTSMGKDWTLWQSIRELYSNAVDEGLVMFEVVTETQLADLIDTEKTTIIIQMNDELEQFMFTLDDYFAMNKTVLYENERGRIYKKHGSKACIYRKGIRCYETDLNSVFDYDLFHVDINEDRLIKYQWELNEEIWKLLYSCNDPKILRHLVGNLTDDSFLESRMDNSCLSLSYTDLNDESWSEAISGKRICPKTLAGYVSDEERPKTLFLPTRLYHALVALKGNHVQSGNFVISERGHIYQEVQLTPLQAQTLKEI